MTEQELIELCSLGESTTVQYKLEFTTQKQIAEELAGDLAAYSMATDWDINQVWAVILPFIQKYGQAKRADFSKIVGDHLTEKQLRRFLDIFKANGFLKTEGQNKNTVYFLGDSYTANNSLINKALAIGLKELKEKGEI